MRLLVGVAVEGDVIEMALPASVPLAHLLPEVRAVVEMETKKPATVQLVPRRVDGEWLDLERSLGQQNCASGSLICLEERGAADRVPPHDPVTEIAERGPPTELVPEGAVTLVVGAAFGALLATRLGDSAALLVAGAPLVWAVLPLLGGTATGATSGWVRSALQVASAGAGSAAMAASGVVASRGLAGVVLDSCVAGAVVVHVGRRRSTNALPRVTLGALEWWLLGAILPLTALAAGWSGW